jgi:hypothetical protein
MLLRLVRFAYTPTETQGKFIGIDGVELWTIERPWVRGPYKGGASFESCVPDGVYQLVPHTRPDGTATVALVNEDLGVWYQKDDRPEDWGRYLVLIHSGNYVDDVVGCIAPGLSRTIYNNRIMVGSSRAAMRQLNVRQYTEIEITTTLGAKDG